MALLWRMLSFTEHLLCLHPPKINLLVMPSKCHQHPAWGEGVQVAFVCSWPLYTDARTAYDGKETAWPGETQNASAPFLGRSSTGFCPYLDFYPFHPSERCKKKALGESNTLKHTFFFKRDNRAHWPLWEWPGIHPHRLSSFSMIRL